MTFRYAVLSGRKELLAWLNNLCNSTYPSVESLRDGAAYCTVVEAAISRIAQNCTATNSPDAPIANSCAKQARAYLNKVDWSATAFVCEGGDPSLDPMPVRTACAHNMQILQDLLHDCVPVEHLYTAEADRLASGKLQDHVLLLRWLYAFMSKVLAHYSRRALEKKGEVVAGAVEGVKLNRTALLRSGQVGASANRENHVPAQVREADAAQRHTSSSYHTDATKGPAARTPSGSFPPTPRSPQSRAKDLAQSPDHGSGEKNPSHAYKQRTDKGTLSAIPASSSSNRSPAAATTTRVTDELPREKAVHSHYTRGTFTVPEHLRETLVDLRNGVEDVEEVVLYVQEQHNFYLTRPAHDARTYTPSVAVQNAAGRTQFKLDARDTLSLETLGELLEERDALSQQYAALDAIIGRALQQTREQNKKVSPLLRDLADLLHPG